MSHKFMNYLIPALMLVGGLFFVGLGFKNYNDQKNGVKVFAVVSKIEEETRVDADGVTTEEAVYVRYTVDGKEYNERLSFFSGSYKEGDEITVLYDPQKPSYVIGTSKIGPPLYLAFGAVVTISGIVGMFRAIKSKGELGAGYTADNLENSDDPDEEEE